MATDVVAAVIAVVKIVLSSKVVQKLILTAAISALSRSLQPKSKASAIDRSSRLTKRRDATPFREAILGTGATAGSFVDGVAYGPDQMMYLEIIRLADHECDGLVSVFSGGKTLTINGDGSVQEYVESGTPRMWIWFEAGSWNATAHSEVITAFGGRYDANDRGRGICRVVVKCDMRSEKLFPGRAVPELRFVIRGARIYIPRLDVSLGGSHQWGNYATYQWTDNLADIAYNVARGIYQYGGATPDFVAGGSYEAEELPLAHYAAEGAACATQIALKGGGSEARYRGGIIIQDNEELEDALVDLAVGAGGRMLELGGSLLFHAGIARTPVATLTDKDFIQGKTARTWRVRARERFNVVSGKFVDTSLRYEVGPLPERRSPSDIARDNGEERVDTLTLGVVQSGTQGQRIMEISRRLNRRSGLFTAQLPPAWQHLEAGDWINYTSAKRGWTKTFVIMPLEMQTGQEDMLANKVTLVEVSANDFTWNPATDQLDVTNPATVGPAIVPDGSIDGFAASAATLVNGSESAPAINVSWTPPTDPTVVQVAVEYQRLGESIWARQSEVATTGGAQITGLSGGTWRVRLVPITKPLRPVTTTSVISVLLQGILASGAESVPWDGVTGPQKPEDNATLGARVGTTLFPNTGTTPLPATEVLNSSITIDANGRLTNTGAGTSVVDNSKIQIDAFGILSGIGTGGVIVDNSKVSLTGLGYTGPTNPTRNVVATGLLANRPAGSDGDFFYATDDNNGAGLLYSKIAGAWVADPKAKVLFDSLSTTVNGNEATNSAFRSAQASDNAAQAARLTTLDVSYRFPMPEAINKNSNFAVWSGAQGTIPEDWIDWANGSANIKMPGSLSPFAFRTPKLVGTANQGIQQVLDGKMALGWHVLECEVTLNDVSFVGAAAALDWGASSITNIEILNLSSDPDIAGVVIGVGTAGRRYRFSKLFNINVVPNVSNLYCMTSWEGVSAQGVAKDITWHKCLVRAASQGEIDAKVAKDTTIPSLTTRVSTEESARASADAALAARATTLEASVNDGTTGLAATRTRVLNEESARASADAALASQAASLSAAVGTNTSQIASVSLVAADGKNRAYAISGTQTEVNGRKGGFVMDNNGDVTNFQITADDFRIYQSVGGSYITPLRVVGGRTQINDALIRSLNVIPDGGGPSHRVHLRPNSYSGADGASFTFATPYGGIPLVRPVILQPPALGAGESYDVSATALSSSGFTVRAKKFTAGTPAAQATGAGSNVGGTPQWRANKPTVSDADGNSYTFNWTATLNRIDYEPTTGGYIAEYFGEFDVYYNTGGGFVFAYRTEVREVRFSAGLPATTRSVVASTTAVLPALGQHGAEEFGLHPATGAISAFAGVTYTTTSQSSVTALPGNFTFDVYPPT